MIATLTELYPTETVETVAQRLGIGRTSVNKKARELGLSKGMKRAWLEKANDVRALHPDHSITEISQMIGASRRTVSRIIALLNLHKDKSEEKAMRSRIRTEMVKRERRRVVFGLDPITRIKVVTNKKKIALRHKLKKMGCLVTRGANIIYYSDDNLMSPERITAGRSLGLRLMPMTSLYESQTAI